MFKEKGRNRMDFKAMAKKIMKNIDLNGDELISKA
jgi:hypothetical protein